MCFNDESANVLKMKHIRNNVWVKEQCDDIAIIDVSADSLNKSMFFVKDGKDCQLD